MIKIIVGHRGVGKSELVKRWRLYLADQDVDFVDLDDEIESKIGRTIPELFLEKGEAYFRDLERQMLIEVLQRNHSRMTYLCLGAGFDLSVLPETAEVIWVRRRTDQDGRIFLNRPRLNPEISPLEEFRRRALVREEFYRSRATEIYTMPEGDFEFKNHAQVLEKKILTNKLDSIGGVFTILPFHLARPAVWKSFRLRFGGKGILFELRNDLLSAEQIQQACADLAEEKKIYSFRARYEVTNLPDCDYYDWPLDQRPPAAFIGAVPVAKRIFSWHGPESGDQLKDLLALLENREKSCAQLKLSPLVKSFPDLLILTEWQQRSSHTRSLLPRSEDGRWSWYRRLQKNRQLLNFWREGDGSAADQPILFDWLATPERSRNFAAVLGDPVHHSFTPLEQMDYFFKRGAPVFAVEIHRDEWFYALPILVHLGLKWAAVTSPLKEMAAEILSDKSLKAVNTLFFDHKSNQWLGTSTDERGFQEQVEGIGLLAPLQSQICIWGGGGILEMLKRNLPLAQFASARSGQSRDPRMPLTPPELVIWAAPRSPETQMPPREWKPRMVVDLNYKEDSLGREYAQLTGANYESGLRMFQVQAQEQRLFWSRCEEDSQEKIGESR